MHVSGSKLGMSSHVNKCLNEGKYISSAKKGPEYHPHTINAPTGLARDVVCLTVPMSASVLVNIM
eukprot:227616-Chlamydomonas_euryale.AAC.1